MTRALSILRGDRMLERFTLRGHPVTFSGVELLMAIWKCAFGAIALLDVRQFAGSFMFLERATHGIIPWDVLAAVFAIVGAAHVGVMLVAWFGIARPPRLSRIAFNFTGGMMYGFVAGVGLGSGLYTISMPYALMAIFALSNMQRAIRNGRGYRALP